MPVVWLGLGLVVVAAFTAALGMHFGFSNTASGGASVRQSAAEGPTQLSR